MHLPPHPCPTEQLLEQAAQNSFAPRVGPAALLPGCSQSQSQAKLGLAELEFALELPQATAPAAIWVKTSSCKRDADTIPNCPLMSHTLYQTYPGNFPAHWEIKLIQQN